MGAVVLHAAVLDSRIKRVVILDTLASYRMIVDEPLHRNVSEVVIPGVLTKYDMADLIAVLAPRRVIVLNPRDATGLPVDWKYSQPNLLVSDHAAPDPLPLD
jgi:hypothetical protein